MSVPDPFLSIFEAKDKEVKEQVVAQVLRRKPLSARAEVYGAYEGVAVFVLVVMVDVDPSRTSCPC